MKELQDIAETIEKSKPEYVTEEGLEYAKNMYILAKAELEEQISDIAAISKMTWRVINRHLRDNEPDSEIQIVMGIFNAIMLGIGIGVSMTNKDEN